MCLDERYGAAGELGVRLHVCDAVPETFGDAHEKRGAVHAVKCQEAVAINYCCHCCW